MEQNDGNIKAVIAFGCAVRDMCLENKRICVDPFSHAPGLLLTLYFDKQGVDCFAQQNTNNINPVFFESESIEVIRDYFSSRIQKTIDRVGK